MRRSSHLAVRRTCQGVGTKKRFCCGIGSVDKLRSRNPSNRSAAATNPDPFGVTEEEQFVLLNWAANRIAELIARENLSGNTARITVKAIRCQSGDTVELITGTVKSVGAGDGSHVNDATRGTPVFSRKITGDDAKLLDRVERNCLTHRSCKVVNVFDAVEQDARARRTHTVNRVSSAAPTAGIGGNVTCSANQVIRVSRQGRQLADLLIIDNGG